MDASSEEGDAIRSNQWQSMAINGNQWRCHAKQSEAINVAVTFAREMPSEAIKCNQVQSSAINVAVTFAMEMPPVGIHVMVVYGAERALSIVRPPNGSAGKNLR